MNQAALEHHLSKAAAAAATDSGDSLQMHHAKPWLAASLAIND